jgi:ubiquinone/menaquinone biosynthesis C-methylase UbiE
MIGSSLDNEIVIQDLVSELYEGVRYVKEYSRMYQDAWYADMISLIGQEGLVLDNGCGIGYLMNFVPPERTVGFDISSRMLDKAKGKMELLVRGDSQKLPFRDESFDVIVCRSLVHHLPDPQAGIDEMDRVLKPGGEIVFAEPIKSLLSGLPRKLTNGGDHFSELHKDFKQKELIDMIGSRFDIDVVSHFGYVAYPVLGFPDIVDPMKFLPWKQNVASLLIRIDRIISRIPLARTQSWGALIKARKRTV